MKEDYQIFIPVSTHTVITSGQYGENSNWTMKKSEGDYFLIDGKNYQFKGKQKTPFENVPIKLAVWTRQKYLEVITANMSNTLFYDEKDDIMVHVTPKQMNKKLKKKLKKGKKKK